MQQSPVADRSQADALGGSIGVAEVAHAAAGLVEVEQNSVFAKVVQNLPQAYTSLGPLGPTVFGAALVALVVLVVVACTSLPTASRRPPKRSRKGARPVATVEPEDAEVAAWAADEEMSCPRTSGKKKGKPRSKTRGEHEEPTR